MKLGRRPTGVALVTSGAIGGGRDVVVSLASGIAAIVATGAVGGAGEGAVISFGAGPATGGLVAVLAHRLAAVRRGIGFGGQAVG